MRKEICLTNEEIESEFESVGEPVCVSEEYGCDISLTRDTIESFEEASKNFREYSSMERCYTERGFRTLKIMRAQVRKGDQRRDIVVVDFGTVRACTKYATATSFVDSKTKPITTPIKTPAFELTAPVADEQVATPAPAKKSTAQNPAERAEIARASFAAAESFELGGDPLDNLTGQTALFF